MSIERSRQTQQNGPTKRFSSVNDTAMLAFEDWLSAELPRLLGFAVVLCGGRDPAEEIVQDVALKVYARWARIAGLEHREAYVRRMIVNEFLSWRRKWVRVVPKAELLEPAPSRTGFAEQHADRAELVAQLDKLPRRQRAVLVLRYLEGWDDAAIAEGLACSAVTVRTHASRGLAALRIEMLPSSAPTSDLRRDSRAY